MPYFPPASGGGSSDYVPSGYAHNVLPRTPRTGAWYGIPNGTGAVNSTVVLFDTQVMSVGFQVVKTPSRPLGGIFIYVTTAATAGIGARVALYKATDDGVPIEFAADLGTHPIDSVGRKNFNTGVPTLTPGPWAACITAVSGGGSGSIRAVHNGQAQSHGMIQSQEGFDNQTGGPATLINVTIGATGAWPTNLPAPGTQSGNPAPRFGFFF